MAPNKRRPKSKRKKSTGKLHEKISIVGPDCVQLLRGSLFQRQVALVLCGESHYDAIDVTRSGGRFHAKYGWIELEPSKCFYLHEQYCCRLLVESKKGQPLAKTREWAKEWVEEQEDYDIWCDSNECQLLLLWIPSGTDTRTNKGKAYVLEVLLQDLADEEYYMEELPPAVLNWKEEMSILAQRNRNEEAATNGSGNANGGTSRYKMFELGDLDQQANALNRRRLTEETISQGELDSIIEERKQDRKRQDIWTFDDWFSHVQRQQEVDTHLILEASVPPWEVELHRPTEIRLQPAHDCIRCVSEDSDESTVDMHDPASDGIGTYVDFVYRKFMHQMMEEQEGHDTSEGNGSSDVKHGRIESTWLHCVDTRDLGCEDACHSDEVKKRWNDLLLPQELKVLSAGHDPGDDVANYQLFRPASTLNPEVDELESMRSKGMLQEDDSDHEYEKTESHLEFSFPSFEGFFGQNTDCMYYTPHVKLCYSPFLAKCVGSLTNWEKFATRLFFGGTICDAISLLDLDDSSQSYAHVRSPILKEWNIANNEYIWKERHDDYMYISFPYFPHLFYLKARNSVPPRTWSSQLYAKLSEDANQLTDHDGMSPKELAHVARQWALSLIRRHAADPKNSDDTECGGEWFAAFLRGAHRDLYEDIDTTDVAHLLKKNYIASESGGRRAKHNIGKIKVPNTRDGFDEIVQRFQLIDSEAEPLLPRDEKIITQRVEALAKILIDIWISILIDFSTVLKVADVVSSDKARSPIVVVCYLGSAHVRAIADFYCNEVGFRKTTFVGKYNWEEDEVKTLKLPSVLWNLSDLFKS